MRKFVVKLKPLLIKLLEKIEQVEQKFNLQYRVKSIPKQKFSLPDWIQSFVIVIIFCAGLIVKSFAIGRTEKIELLIRILGFLLLFYFVVNLLIRYYVKKVKTQFNLKSEEYKNSLKLFLTLTLIQVSLFIIWQINNINWYLIPTNGFVILAGLLLNLWWSVAFITLNVLFGSYLYPVMSFDMFTYMLIYLLTAVYVLSLVEKVSSRQDLIVVIGKSTVVNFLIFILVNLMMFYDVKKMFEISFNFKIFGFSTDFNILNFAVLSILNGIGNWLVVMSLLSPLETIYQRTTNIKLVELSNFNHPLLKQLMTEAPGTYHHSLVVSSLAENVALNLGINSLLCKIGGIYHDIGKITQPEYFIENQFAKKNPHGDINPSLSALVIINHVKEGVKLAYEYKLDKPIIDIIEQHHGNSVIFGLYNKNLELNFFDKELLRYPGPKPQTKEAAIIMICDSCEAACRSIQDREPQKIKEMVEYVINSKFVDGQFDEAPLTLRELYVISNIVTQMMISFYHLRSTNGSK